MLTKGGYTVRILERPGLWMKPDELADIRAKLRQIATATLPADQLTYGVFSEETDRLNDTVLTLITRADGTPIAFNALALIELEVKPEPIDLLHLGLVMVAPEERSKNLSWMLYGLTCFLFFLKNQMRPIWISNVTQVPAVVGMVANTFSQVWPQPKQGDRTLMHLFIARTIMRDHRQRFGVGEDAEFKENQFIIANSYTGGSDALKKRYEEAAQHRDASFNEFCQQQLDYDRGDDLLQVGRIDLPAMRGYLTRNVPANARRMIVIAGLGIALRRMVLPVLHWSDSSKHWSILRPANGAK